MKSSSNIQIETEEFLALLKLAKPLVKALAKAISRDSSYRKGYTSVVTEEVDLDEADDDVVDGADHFVPDPDDNAIPFPRAVEPAAPAPQAAPLPDLGKGMSYIKPSEIPTPRTDHPLVIKGRDLFPQFINRWMEGFGDFDAPQPDRVDLLRSTMTTHGGAILSYLRSAGGLIAGTREALAANGAAFDDKFAIELASNIAQISSIFHPELTDVMEFIRPDGTVNSNVRYEQVRIPLDGSKE